MSPSGTGESDDGQEDGAAVHLADLPPTDDHPVLLFDGACNLCDSLVQFIVPRDNDGTLRFASLQSPVGQALLAAHELPTDDFDTFVLIEDDVAYTKSEGALRACRYLDGHYPLLRSLLVVPRPIRDRVYDVVAANRYDWFGTKDACMLPTEGIEERFLDDGVGSQE